MTKGWKEHEQGKKEHEQREGKNNCYTLDEVPLFAHSFTQNLSIPMIRITRAALSSRVLCVYIVSYALYCFFSHASHLPCRSFKPALLISFSQPIVGFISIGAILAWSHGFISRLVSFPRSWQGSHNKTWLQSLGTVVRYLAKLYPN